MLAWNTEENTISSISYRTSHTVGPKEVSVVKDCGTGAGVGILEQNNIMLSVLWLRERKQQDKSYFGSALSLGLRVVSSICYLLLMKQYIVRHRCYFESVFIFFEN